MTSEQTIPKRLQRFVFQIEIPYGNEADLNKALSDLFAVSRRFMPLKMVALDILEDEQVKTQEIAVERFLAAVSQHTSNCLLITAFDHHNQEAFIVNWGNASLTVYVLYYFLDPSATAFYGIDIKTLYAYLNEILEINPSFITFRDVLNFEWFTFAKDYDMLLQQYYGVKDPAVSEFLSQNIGKIAEDTGFSFEDRRPQGVMFLQNDLYLGLRLATEKTAKPKPRRRSLSIDDLLEQALSMTAKGLKKGDGGLDFKEKYRAFVASHSLRTAISNELSARNLLPGVDLRFDQAWQIGQQIQFIEGMAESEAPEKTPEQLWDEALQGIADSLKKAGDHWRHDGSPLDKEFDALYQEFVSSTESLRKMGTPKK